MQTTVQILLSASTDNRGFSLDEFVLTLHTLMEERGLAGVASLVLNLIEERLCLDLCQQTPNTWRPEAACCSMPRYELAQRRGRTFRTRIGALNIPWRTLRCRRCGKTLIPLRDFLGLSPYQRKTSELEQLVVEVVSEQSYRRATSHLDKIGLIPVPKSTAHRWVADSDCDAIDTGVDTMNFLFSDGSGYKRRPDNAAGLNNRGEVRVAFGIDSKGDLRPLGAWSHESWATIAQQVQGRRRDDQPVAETFLGDGEPGMVEAMGKLCDFTQRCHWHAGRDLNYAMWKNDAPLAERKTETKELAGILGISLPKEDVELVSPDDKMDLEDAVQDAEERVEMLCRRLFRKGYIDAWTYVKRMKHSLFEYVRRWLATGLVSPRAASLIERLMREIARRLKRLGHGWSPKGAAKMACIILKRFRNATSWENYWKKKLRLDGKVTWLLQKIEPAPTLLGR
jgi:hypothetical protein